MPRAMALIAVVLWGVSFVATKAVLREISPVALIFTRFAMGTALLWLILVVKRRKVSFPRSEWRSLALMGLVGIFIHQLLQAHGLQLTSAVSTGWLVVITPIWSAILARLTLNERLGPIKIAGLVLGFLGALLVISKGELSSQTLALPSTSGDLLILASTLNWAIYTVLGQPTIRRLGPIRVTAGATLLGWLMLSPLFVGGSHWREYPALSTWGWISLTFLGIGCSGLGYLFWYGALERVEATQVASFLYVEPLVTFVAATILLREPVRVLTVIGGLIVLGGVVLIQRYEPVPRPGTTSERPPVRS